jgi:glycosyltransferase involved in cell wall biosynthesis
MENGYKKERIKVTFIIPARNSEKTLNECLVSILGQSIGRDIFEVLVIDNGSTDRTVRIAKEKGLQVLNGPGLTVSALRNLGVRNSQGEILAFVDSDCVIASDWLRNAIPLFDNPEIGAAGAPTLVPENGTWVQWSWYMHRKKRVNREYVKWLPTENLLVKREIFEKIGGFNEELVTCEDVDLCYRIEKTHKIICDSSISAVHLGEARTLLDFFKKERWRGKGSFIGSALHGLIVNEIPSLLTPFYGLMILTLFIYAILRLMLNGDSSAQMAFVAILVFPPLIMAIRTSIRVNSLKCMCPLVILYIVYVAARTVSLIIKR